MLYMLVPNRRGKFIQRIREMYPTYTLQLLQYARMQILIHVTVFQSILCRLGRTGNAGVKTLKLTRKAYANLEGIHAGVQVDMTAIGDRKGGVSRRCSYRRFVIITFKGIRSWILDLIEGRDGDLELGARALRSWPKRNPS